MQGSLAGHDLSLLRLCLLWRVQAVTENCSAEPSAPPSVAYVCACARCFCKANFQDENTYRFPCRCQNTYHSLLKPCRTPNSNSHDMQRTSPNRTIVLCIGELLSKPIGVECRGSYGHELAQVRPCLGSQKKPFPGCFLEPAPQPGWKHHLVQQAWFKQPTVLNDR